MLCCVSVYKSFRRFIVTRDEFDFIYADELTLFDNELATDNGVIHSAGLAEHHGRDRVMQRPGVIQPVQVNRGEIRAFSALQAANIRATQDIRPATRSEPEGFACGH
jgi:hypothetical protein